MSLGACDECTGLPVTALVMLGVGAAIDAGRTAIEELVGFLVEEEVIFGTAVEYPVDRVRGSRFLDDGLEDLLEADAFLVSVLFNACACFERLLTLLLTEETAFFAVLLTALFAFDAADLILLPRDAMGG